MSKRFAATAENHQSSNFSMIADVLKSYKLQKIGKEKKRYAEKIFWSVKY